MKSFQYTIVTFAIAILSVGVWSCSDPDVGEPNLTNSSTTSTSNFLFVNASTDASALDLYVNNLKVGADLAAGEHWDGYQTIPITADGVFANTNIRAKAASGTIGGTLKTADLIYRAGNANSNNFQASGNAKYTIFVVDSIGRPKPIRTLNKDSIGDVTYYSSKAAFVGKKKTAPAEDTTIVLKVGSSNSIITANVLKKYNGNALPSFFVPIGTVPLGSSDPGGVRFYLVQDVIPADAADKAGIRFFNLSPNAPTLYARIVPGDASATFTVSGTATAPGVAYAMSQSAFNPTVGSRTVTSTTSTFPQFKTASSGTPIVYTLEISTKADFSTTLLSVPNQTFEQKKNYSVYVSGMVGDNLTATVIQH